MKADIFGWPCWYPLIAWLWSIYQGTRAVVEQHHSNASKMDHPLERWIILYVHDFAFRFICTMAGFIALYACYVVATSGLDWTALSTGTGTFLVGSFIVGVIGVGGQLHYVILLGKTKA